MFLSQDLGATPPDSPLSVPVGAPPVPPHQQKSQRSGSRTNPNSKTQEETSGNPKLSPCLVASSVLPTPKTAVAEGKKNARVVEVDATPLQAAPPPLSPPSKRRRDEDNGDPAVCSRPDLSGHLRHHPLYPQLQSSLPSETLRLFAVATVILFTPN